MKKVLSIFVVGMLILLVGGVCSAQEKAPQKIVDLANTTLAALGTDQAIVDAVKAENAKGKTAEQVQAMDTTWQATAGIDDMMKGIMENACATKLKEIQGSQPYYAEIFVTDNQGANVAMTDKTSDYWQGDEPKFTEAFKGGVGAVYISDVKFDDSTQAYLVQVSVPVMDGTAAIGTITIGVDVDKVA